MARPLSPLLDRDRIAVAALEESARSGDFTVARLAARLGVHPSSLYHHVAGRQEVVDLMREHVAGEIDSSAVGVLPWDEALVSVGRSYYATFVRHAGSIGVLTGARVQDAATLAVYDGLARSMLDAGFDAAQTSLAIAAFDSLVLGAAVDRMDPGSMYAADPVEHPALSAVLEARTAVSAAEAFEASLDALVAGLRHILSSSSASSTGAVAEVSARSA